jgi:signal transduction histidine kinase
VRADAEKLQQILINLLSNAIKFTPEGGTISVRCDVDARKVHIDVTDSGIGIAADRLERIFDPFIQVGRALNRPHEGVGLGLSISRDLALAMGGALSVRSTPSEGSTFTLTLDKA